jgi:hypothetical protein
MSKKCVRTLKSSIFAEIFTGFQVTYTTSERLNQAGFFFICQPHGQTTFRINFSFAADQKLGKLKTEYFVLNICGSFTSTLHGLHACVAQIPGIHIWYDKDS